MSFIKDGYYKCEYALNDEEVFIEKPKGPTPCKMICYYKNCQRKDCNYKINYSEYSNTPGNFIPEKLIFIRDLPRGRIIYNG